MSKDESVTANFIVQKWEESERGWGCRPDGYSLHLSEEDRTAYIQKYWKQMPDKTPDEYSRPSGTPYEASVKLSREEIGRMKKQRGLRFFSGKLPGSGGKDGWCNVAA